MRQWFSQGTDDFRIPEAAGDDPEAWAQRQAAIEEALIVPREHVMLKRASILPPDGTPIQVQLWRGRLSHVSGWWIGRTEKT